MPEANFDLVAAAECLLFVGREPVPAARLAKCLEVAEEAVAALIEELNRRLEGHGLRVLPLAGGYSLATREEYAEPVRAYLEPEPEQLSRAALETLAIVAYRQPITRPQIEQIRGVNSAGVLRALLDRRVLTVAGREDAPGRPYRFATTPQFLSLFGLHSLEDLPPLSEDVAEHLAERLGQAEAPAEAEAEEEPPFDFEA